MGVIISASSFLPFWIFFPPMVLGLFLVMCHREHSVSPPGTFLGTFLRGYFSMFHHLLYFLLRVSGLFPLVFLVILRHLERSVSSRSMFCN